MFSFVHTTNTEKGMTFIEVIVVMGIFAAIAATVLFNYRDFSSNVKLQNLAQEIALQGKRAQTLASQGRFPVLSNTQVQGGNAPGFDWVSSYGLAFRLPENSKSFIFYFNNFDPDEQDPVTRELYFSDFVDSDYIGCGSTADSECVEEIRITDGSYIDMICINSEPNVDPECLSGVQSPDLYVSFTRPFLEASLLDTDHIFDGELGPIGNAFVRVSSQDGEQHRYVSFWSTGQIGVH